MARSTVVGIFHEIKHERNPVIHGQLPEPWEPAEEAVEELRRLGFRDEQIGFAAPGGPAAGANVETLVGMGIPEEQARYYRGEFDQDGILVTVSADDRDQQDEARAVLLRHGAYHVEAYGGTDTSAGRESAA